MPVFAASTTCISHIYSVLKAVTHVSSKVSLTIYDGGIKFTADTEAHACQAHLLLMESLFTSFEFNDPNDDSGYITVNISLKALTQCLQMFVQSRLRTDDGHNNSGSSANNSSGIDSITSTCRFYYDGDGTPFVLYFKEGQNLVTKCDLATFEDDYRPSVDETGDDDEPDTGAIELDKDSIVQQVITKGDIIYDAIKELETMKTEVVTIQGQSLVSPHFVLISEGGMGTTQIVFPNEKAVLETFDIPGGETSNVVVRNSYKFSLLSKALDALSLATKVSLRCDANGTMSIQSMCQVDSTRQSFIDFRFQPNEES